MSEVILYVVLTALAVVIGGVVLLLIHGAAAKKCKVCGRSMSGAPPRTTTCSPECRRRASQQTARQ